VVVVLGVALRAGTQKQLRLNTIIQEVNALLNTVNINHLGET
jgi:hypothetical protein